jgi:cell filamentation protein
MVTKSHITSQKELVDCLAYAHHRYTQIHPFNNGNGRTARLLTNLIANINGYQNVQLYVTESGNEREKYRAALRSADAFDYAPLKSIINQRLLRF